MHSPTISTILAFGLTLVCAHPAPETMPETAPPMSKAETPTRLEVRQDGTYPFPIVATYEAVMGEVDPAYVQFLEENIVIRLNDPYKRDGADMSKGSHYSKRQAGTCDIQGFAIVNGQLTPFEGTVQNAAANFGRAVTLTGVLPGCSIALIPQSNCGLWSVVDTSNCATSRSVTFS